MIGTITEAFINAIRASQLVDEENISVVIANDNGEGTVNTALPAVAVAVKGTEKDTGEAIGGMPFNEYLVQLAVITNFDNQAASDDDKHQYRQMDLAYKLMIYLHQARNGEFFKELREGYDFQMAYKGVETEQTRAMERELGEVDVFVFRLMYICTFLSKEVMDMTPSAELKEISSLKLLDMTVDSTDIITPNRAKTWQKR